jgi:hypothetical protein
MKDIVTAAALAASLAMGFFLVQIGASRAQQEDWQQQVAQALGKTGTSAAGMYRVGLPRTDIKATLDGIELKPGFALGGWLAFEKMGTKAMVMGDLVLTEDEVNPVMAKLLEGGIEVSALHNHLLRNRPFTMYMHVLGQGDPVKLATLLHEALAQSKTPMGPAAPAASPPPAIDLDTAALDRAIGAKGTNNGGVYQYGIPRAEPVSHGDMVIPNALGLANAINFEPLGGGKAAITGDFVLTDKEVAPVMKALCESGIEVTALHNHMVGEQPRLYFMHFWAHDDALKLAAGIKAALGHVNVAHG